MDKRSGGKGRGYVGNIPNSGTMDVSAPHQKVHPKTGTVIKGGDLRTGKK